MIRILHVDDDIFEQELVSINLNRLADDLNVEWVESALIALAKLEEDDFDLIICDFQMPEMTGLQFLTDIRNQGNHTPFIFLTGQGNEQLAAESFRAGASDYFTKEESFAHYDRLLNSIRRLVAAAAHDKEFRLAEKKYKKLYDDNIAGVFQTSTSGKMLECNRAFKVILGYSPDENLLGADVSEWYADKLERAKYLSEVTKQGRVNNYELHFISQQGEDIWVLNNAVLLDKGIIQGTLIDITKRKKAVFASKRSDEKLRRMMEQAPIATQLYDLDGTMLLVNKAWGELWGVEDYQQFQGKYNILLDPQARELGVDSDYKNAVLGETVDVKPFIYDPVTSDNLGRIRTLICRFYPLLGEDGEVENVVQTSEDISDRLAAEEKLKESEESLSVVLSSIDEAVIATDLHGKIIRMNPMAEILTGWALHEVREKQLVQVLSIVDAETREKVENPIGTIIKTGETTDCTERTLLISRSGHEYSISGSGAPLRNHDGEIVGVVLVFKDVSSESQNEDKLGHYQDLMDENAIARKSIDVSPMLLLHLDTSGTIKMANRKCCDFFGLQRQDMIGRSWNILTGNSVDSRAELESILSGNENFTKEKTISMKSADSKVSNIRWFREVVTGMDKTVEGLVLAGHEIPRTSTATPSLEYESDFYNIVINNTADIIFVKSREGKYLKVNSALEKMFSVPASEIIGQKDSDFFDYDLVSEILEDDAEVLKGRTTQKVAEIKINDVVRRIHTIKTPFFTDSGSVGGIIGVGRDVTNRHAREEELKEINELLVAANAELEAFSYSVSHDLQAPIRHIEGFSQLLLLDENISTSDPNGKYVRNISDCATRMKEIVDSMLILSGINKANLVIGSVDVSELSRDILKKLVVSIPWEKIDYQIEENLIIQGDRNLLKIALENLLGNAVKYSEKREKPLIEIGRQKLAGKDVYFVRDNGSGFDSEFAEDIFAPFTRLHSHTDFKGCGVGLATVDRIIKRHNGKVWAESKAGDGATFYFTFD